MPEGTLSSEGGSEIGRQQAAQRSGGELHPSGSTVRTWRAALTLPPWQGQPPSPVLAKPSSGGREAERAHTTVAAHLGLRCGDGGEGLRRADSPS